MNVTEAVLSRRSVRQFLDKPVDLEVIRAILDKARWAPSGCNFQPWEAAVLSGEPLRELQEKMLASEYQEPKEYDWSAPEAIPECLEAVQTVGATLYSSMGVSREDTAAREAFVRTNTRSFNAPAVLFCYMPRLMKEPQWSDVGMWLQTIMLLAREAGLDTCPQEYLSLHAKVIKDYLGVSDESHIFFCGMAIGYGDRESPVNQWERERFDLDHKVKFLGF